MFIELQSPVAIAEVSNNIGRVHIAVVRHGGDILLAVPIPVANQCLPRSDSAVIVLSGANEIVWLNAAKLRNRVRSKMKEAGAQDRTWRISAP
jgi:hypothetical protein